MSRPRRINPRIAAEGILQLGAGVRARIASKSLLEGVTVDFPLNQAHPDAVILSAMSERVFQAHVVTALKDRGYLVWTVPDMTKTARGLPDVIAVHPTRVPRRVLFYELKSQRGRVRPEQADALAALSDVHGVDARIVRPADWPELRDALDSGEPAAAGEG